MGKAAVVRAFGEIRAALAVLNAEVDEAGMEPFSAADPLAAVAAGCLDILAGAREVEAGFAGLKAKAAVKYAESAYAVAGPGAPVQSQGPDLAGTPPRREHRETPRQGGRGPAGGVPAGPGRNGVAVRVPA